MKILHVIALTFLTFNTTAVLADSFKEKCPDIASCTIVMSQLLGQKYVHDSDIKGKWDATANLEITKDNAELLFTNMLYSLGFSRMPLGTPNTYQIARTRDVKDLAIPTYYGNLRQDPKFSDLWDYATLVYTTVDSANTNELARVLRNFMPPNTRIIALESGKLLVTDAQANLKKMYQLLKEIDVKPTAEMKAKWAAEIRNAKQ